MKSIFSYDSPMMQILSYIGDLIILNFIYLLCCIPVLTIGAAQAGLYTAMRVLNDKEDDSSVVAAFFRGFKNGFLKITLAWGLMFGLMAVVSYACIWAYTLGLPTWICIVPVCICALFISQIPAFHSRFDCQPLHLFRNSFVLIIAHPLRAFGNALLIWAPVIVLLCSGMYIFMGATPLWLTLYYSTAFLFGELFLRKPFKTLVDDFNAKQAEEAGEEEPEEEKESLKVFEDVPGK